MANKHQKGSLNPNWKGGRSQLKSGYVRDNLSGKNVHTLVMEQEMGRALAKPEMVHHVDGDKANNVLDNLVFCANPREHRLLHASLEQVAFELVRAGVIRFDKKTKQYRS